MISHELAQRIMTASRKGSEWVERRDALILEALEKGASQREVAKYAGISQPAISGIVSRHEDAN